MFYLNTNPPIVWPFDIIHCGFECKINYASLQQIMWWMHKHSTQSTLLLSDHSITLTAVWMIDKLCQPAIGYHVVNAWTTHSQPSNEECIYTVHTHFSEQLCHPTSPCSWMVSTVWSTSWKMVPRVGGLMSGHSGLKIIRPFWISVF